MLEFVDNVDQFLICSNTVCQKIEAEGGLPPLIDSLKNSEVSESFMEKVEVLLFPTQIFLQNAFVYRVPQVLSNTDFEYSCPDVGP